MRRPRLVPYQATRPAAWLVVLFLAASELAGAANGPDGGALPVVSNLNGIVSVVGRDGVSRDVLSTRLIHSGDKILTGVGSLALVNLADVGGVHLGPATTAVASTTGRSLLVSLLSGSVCAEALTPGVSVTAGSLTLTPAQPGSLFSMLRSTAATTVVVYQGEITAASQDRAGQIPPPVTLSAGQAARFAGAGPLEPLAIAMVQPLFADLQCPSPDVVARVLPTPTPAPQAHGSGAGGIIGALLGIGALVALAGSHGGGSASSAPPTAPPTPVPGTLSVSPTNLSFNVGSAPQTFTASEANYSGPISATSGNTAIATVSPASGNGPGPITFTVTPVAPGSTTITVSDNHGNTQSVSVSVAAPGSIAVNPSSLTFLAGGAPQTFTASEPGYAGPLAAHSNNTGVATVAGGGNGPGPVTFTVTPVGSGTTTIAVTGGAAPATVTVTVIGPLTTSTGSLSFLGTTTPETFTATDPVYTGPLSASTGDPTVATVSGGGNGPGPVTFTVTPVGEGNTTITVSDTFGGSAVVAVSVSTGGLIVNPNSLTILAGQAAPFTASEANYRGKIRASTSNPPILATVSPPSQNGPGPVTFTVNALAAGNPTIGVSSSDQGPVLIPVTITGPLTVTPGSLSFNGTTAPQTLSVSDPNYIGDITASSSNISVATVTSPQTGPNATFTVTPVGVGTAIMTFQDANQGTTSAMVNVAYGPLTVTPSAVNLTGAGATANFSASETFYTGPITASSANPSVATVTPASVNGPGPVTFTITAQGPGTTTVQVSDNHGGSQQVAVNVSESPVVNPASLTFTDVGPSNAKTVAISEPGYTGAFSVTNNTCASQNIAIIGTPSGNGPTASISVEGDPATTSGGTCQFTVEDSLGETSAPVSVTVGPFGAVTPTPASLTFVGAGAAQTFTVAESGYTGVFTVSANACTGVATVSPSSGTSAMTFTVTPVAAGGPCNLAIADDHGQSANVSVTVGPFGSLTVNPSSLSLTVSGASQSFTASETGTGYSGTINVDQTSCATNNVASVSPASGTSGTQFIVSPGTSAGNCKLGITDDHGGTANVLVFVSAGSLTVSPQTIQFTDPSSSSASFSVSDSNSSATTFTASSQNTNVATVSPPKQPGPVPVTFTVTPTGNGQTSITVSDGVGGQAVVSIGVGVSPLVMKRRPVHLHTALPVIPRQRLPVPRQPSPVPGAPPGAEKYPGALPSSGPPAGPPGVRTAAISVSVSGMSLQAGAAGASLVITEPGYAGRFYLNISDPGVARIDPLVASGPAATLTVTGLRPGSAVLRITDDAGNARTVTIFVRPAQAVRPGLDKPGKTTS